MLLCVIDGSRYKEVIVQINVPQSTTQLYVHLNKLISALQDDLDLATIPKDNLPRLFQSWYDDIRSIVSDRITSEEDRMPSRTSVCQH